MGLGLGLLCCCDPCLRCPAGAQFSVTLSGITGTFGAWSPAAYCSPHCDGTFLVTLGEPGCSGQLYILEQPITWDGPCPDCSTVYPFVAGIIASYDKPSNSTSYIVYFNDSGGGYNGTAYGSAPLVLSGKPDCRASTFGARTFGGFTMVAPGQLYPCDVSGVTAEVTSLYSP